MKGWVTWVVAGVTVVYAGVGLFAGLHTSDEAMRLVLYAGGLVGLGRKLDRVNN